ncbi:branched-chain-amino-acid transaminase [Chytriomyces confervae]|uniref:Branched-chain-amino-acid transaminase n=1 Tax=Chytriomyces confervae TaxID=246404 RepID=A0A507DVM2_9FUNG|nr:branched-chain-amino-acid transaminase [Chytriomyces confervae]
MTSQPREPTSAIDWSQPLGFKYRHPRSHIKYVWTKETGWDNGKLLSNHTITMDIASTSLHYGQACFEGMKAFRMKDGKIRIFRPDLNAQRLLQSCKAASMECPPTELFLEALQRVVSDNLDHVPPTDSAGSLYIRPFVVGSGPQLGLSPSPEFSFIILVNAVGPYYVGGLGSPVKALIADSLDRAAPHGTGNVKVSGNYAPVFAATAAANAKGFAVNLFLDPQTHSKVEEFATSNFAGLKRAADGKPIYVTPRSESILKGVTNRSCAELASRHLGWHVERRDVPWSEVKEFEEVVATGTAVVMTAIGEIHREVKTPGKRVKKNSNTSSGAYYDWDLDEEEEVDAKLEMEVVKFDKEPVEFKKLYSAVIELQKGILPGWEAYGWMWPQEGL